MIYQILGAAILLAFYICYFAKMISQRRQGVTTDQMGKGKTGTTHTIEITMKIATYIVPFAEIASIVLIKPDCFEIIRVIGAVIGVFGVSVFIASVVTMRDNWRAGVSVTDKTELVTNGIYGVSRNPAFLGFDLVYIGILLMFFNWVLLAASAFAVIMLHLQIVKVEEKFLIAAFGEDYLNYKNKVCRYLGRKFLKRS